MLRKLGLARWVGAAFVSVAAVAAWPGCGDSGGDGSGGATSGPGPTGSTTTGVVPTCEPACTPPQFCSVQGVCLDPGKCLGDPDCTQPGTVCDVATQTCVPGGCMVQEAGIMPIPPNVLLVLDRSCSMTQGSGSGMTKWEAAVAAITTMTTGYAGQIRFGLTMFPDTTTPDCAQGAIPIPAGPGNEAAIQMLLQNALVNSDPNFPNGPCVTNIDTAMEQASLAPELMDTTRDNYALLITDGKQAGCNLAGGDAGTEMILANMFAAGIPTFVIGFGSGIDPAQMDLFAIAGGVPNSGPAYYDASDQQSLEAALDTIANAAISCTFTLDGTPPNPNDINVFFDGSPVPNDPGMMNGWQYDPATNTIVFYGPACDQLKGGTVMEVQVVLGCPVR